MKISKYPDRNTWPELLKRPAIDNSSLERTVAAVLNKVRLSGDEAILEYTRRFDQAELSSVVVSKAEFDAARSNVSPALKKAIRQAFSNIKKFHEAQKEKEKVIETVKGVKCWRRSVGIDKVGLYIPGGSAPLFSTILMLGIPARIAGCKQVVLCTPPAKDGSINPAILFTAQLAGIKKVYKAGGVQAIAGMAYGTASIPRVFKIFGPGNQYVTCAKQLVNREGVAIDMPAGPSELAVWADSSCVPAFVAADLLSQAEHGPDSQVLLVSTSLKVIAAVERELTAQIENLPRRDIAQQALANSRAILVKTQSEALDLLNEYAPEHLIITCRNEKALAARVRNAGSVFLGNYSPESAGDYASGTNHTLPTNGFARAYSGVSLDSFVKKITFQQLSKQGIRNIGKTIEEMAAAEGLHAHRNAVTLRIQQDEKL